jgi:hypothetical protein
MVRVGWQGRVKDRGEGGGAGPHHVNQCINPSNTEHRGVGDRFEITDITVIEGYMLVQL